MACIPPGIAVGKRASGTPSKGVAPGAMLVPINIFGPNASVSQATILRAFEHIEDSVMENSGPIREDRLDQYERRRRPQRRHLRR